MPADAVTMSPQETGGIAQLVERVVRNDEAWGSNPHTSMHRPASRVRVTTSTLQVGGGMI